MIILQMRHGRTNRIAHSGENEAVRVAFSLAPFKEAFPDGRPALLVRRKVDTQAYPVTLTVDGDTAYWMVTAADTAVAGSGQCELQWYAGDTLAKSDKFDFLVTQALEAGAEPPDEPSTRWFDAIQAQIGDLANLNTKAKANLVAAINEAAKTGSGGAGSISMRVSDGYIQYSTDDGESWENLIAVADLKGEPGEDGAPGKPGEDGKPGADGYSPTAKVEETADGAKITITDKDGTTEATIKNGKDGAVMAITGAAAGQIAKISAVDENGVPTAWAPADMPSGGGGGDVVNNYNTINHYYYSSPVSGKYDLKEGYAVTPDIYIAQDGTETSRTGLNFAVTAYVPVEANVPYTTYGVGYALYDAGKTFLSAVISIFDYGQIREFTPTQTGFVRVTFRRGDTEGIDFARLCKSSEKLLPKTAYLPKQSPFYDPEIPCNVDLYGDSNSYGYGLSDPQNSWANRLGALITSMPQTLINGNAQMSVFSSTYQYSPMLRNFGAVYLSAYTDTFVINAGYVGVIDVKIDGEAQTQMTESSATYNVSLGYHTIELRGASGQNVISSIATNKTRSFTNHAVTGTNSGTLSSSSPNGNVAIVMYGTNDRAINCGDTVNNFANFVTRCAADGITVYLFSPIPTKSGAETSPAYKQTTSDVISQIPDINYINVYKDIQLFSMLSTQTLYSDSLHLNDYGHKVLYAIVASELHLAALNSIFD